MRKLVVSTLVSLDGVIQDPGGFGETAQGGWASPYFSEDAAQESYENLIDSDYFLCGRVTYELLSKAWDRIKKGPYLERMNAIPKLVASRTLKEPLEWNATLIKGDVAWLDSFLSPRAAHGILVFAITTSAVALVLMLAVYWRRWDTD